jgi:CheY-like chemotaxis protein
MDGVALIRWLRADLRARSIPHIVLTAYPGSFARREMLAAGCDEFIVKPIDTRSSRKSSSSSSRG